MQSKLILPHHEYDSPWKRMISDYFELFMCFFFPYAAAEIDWSAGFKQMDKELEKLMRKQLTTKRKKNGNQRVDKLFQVKILSGQVVWVLIHIEVQGQKEIDFAQRMFDYWSMIRYQYGLEVFSCAVLTDDQPNWRPNQFETGLWDTNNRFKFATFKLLDLADQINTLENSNNPFAQAALAHLLTIQTTQDDPSRAAFKFQLIRLLYGKGYSRKMILDLFAFIDWIMLLTPSLQAELIEQVDHYEKEHFKMEYITTWERHGMLIGRLNTIYEFLEASFGPVSDHIRQKLDKISDIEILQQAVRQAACAESLDEFEAWLNQQAYS